MTPDGVLSDSDRADMADLKDVYKFTVNYGSAEWAPAPPGYSRIITRDRDGAVVKDETHHFVCMGFDGGQCMYCGKEMT